MRNLASNEIESVSGGNITSNLHFFMVGFREFYGANAGKLPSGGGWTLLNLVGSLFSLTSNFVYQSYESGLKSANWLRGYLSDYFTEVHYYLDREIGRLK